MQAHTGVQRAASGHTDKAQGAVGQRRVQLGPPAGVRGQLSGQAPRPGLCCSAFLNLTRDRGSCLALRLRNGQFPKRICLTFWVPAIVSNMVSSPPSVLGAPGGARTDRGGKETGSTGPSDPLAVPTLPAAPFDESLAKEPGPRERWPWRGSDLSSWRPCHTHMSQFGLGRRWAGEREPGTWLRRKDVWPVQRHRSSSR